MSPLSASNLRDHAAFSRAYAQHARAVHKVAMSVLNDHARVLRVRAAEGGVVTEVRGGQG